MKKSEDFKRTIVYYTDSRLEEDLDRAVREQIIRASCGIPIISVSQKPLDFGKNICIGIKTSSYLGLYEQLMVGLEAADVDSIIYTCEHDVFYHPSHFDFIPPRTDKIYYNLNRYYWSRTKNYFIKAIGKRALSQGVGYRGVYLSHAREQVDARKNGIASPCIGPFMNFKSNEPNVDIRHGGNLSKSNRFGEGNNEPRIYTIPYWGTPRLLRQKVNVRNPDFDTELHLHRILNPDNKENPVEVPRFFRCHLPGLFYSLGFKSGAEIGVKRGAFSSQICAGMKNVKMKCIDPYHPSHEVGWDEQERRFVMAKYALMHFDAELIKKTSLQAADEDVPKNSLDFVYIDADHSFNAVMQDIIVWTDRVRPGGIVSGHDYDVKDVKEAVNSFVDIHGLELFITEKGSKYPDSSPSWFFAKGK